VAKPVAKKAVPVKKAAAKPAPKPVKAANHPVKAANPQVKAAAPAKTQPIVNHHATNAKEKQQPAPKQVNTPIGKPPVKKQEPPKEVKVPKTSVKTSVPYTPEYKPLDQRKETSGNGDPLSRYNDTDLNEFRELINKKLDAAKKELGYLQGLITRKDEMGGDEAESRYMTMEDGSMSMEREQLSQMASRQITYIDHLEKALIRIENKTYGICRVTGKLIDKARLRAVPHATLSLEAKLGIVKA
jgi:RNA polymerase-binding transcription factor DksA